MRPQECAVLRTTKCNLPHFCASRSILVYNYVVRDLLTAITDRNGPIEYRTVAQLTNNSTDQLKVHHCRKASNRTGREPGLVSPSRRLKLLVGA